MASRGCLIGRDGGGNQRSRNEDGTWSDGKQEVWQSRLAGVHERPCDYVHPSRGPGARKPLRPSPRSSGVQHEHELGLLFTVLS
nr:hypothetical protein CFP56_11617 [Quercus suber]